MKKYEKELEELIRLSNGGCDPVDQEITDMTEAQLRFLAAKGFVALAPAGDDEFWITIEPAGLAYFSDKEESPEARMLEQLKKIADAAQEQANAAQEQAALAREDAGAAREDARIAKRQSRINIGIAILL